MEIKEIGRWDKISDNEVFFDDIFQWYIIKTTNSLTVVPLSLRETVSLALDQESKEICMQDLMQFRIYLEKNLICCLTQQSKLVSFI